MKVTKCKKWQPMKDLNEMRKLSEINRPMNEELFNNLEKQYQELAKIKAESEQIENQAIEEMAKVIKSSLDGLGIGNFNFTGDEISTTFAKALYTAGYRKQEWISVEKRLPKEFVSVLGYMTDAGNFPPVRECYVFGRAFFFPALGEAHPVSHWMPLPEPPKMKGD